MRSLLVLIDGLGDSPIPAWQGQTPFEHAVHPAMDALAASGTLGSLSICENDIIPESCSCILRLLGVDKKDIPHNRAYLELLAHNRDISEYEMVLRCNLAAVDASGRLAAFNGQGLTPLEMQQAAKQCDGILKDIEFIHLSEYRNLLVMNREASVLDCTVQPPHESVGEDVNGLLQELRSQSLSINYFCRSRQNGCSPLPATACSTSYIPGVLQPVRDCLPSVVCTDCAAGRCARRRLSSASPKPWAWM